MKIKQCLQWCFFVTIKNVIRHSYLTPSTKLLFFTRKILFYVNFGIAKTKYSKENLIDESFNYDVNCSGFTNHILSSQCANALQEIKDYIRSTDDKGFSNVVPLCLYYWKFFQDKSTKKYWKVIENAKAIKPGDFIVFCENTEKITKSGQHIMLIAGELQQAKESGWTICPIYDSTGDGHGLNDMRRRNEISGIGEGKIALKIEENGTVSALKWSLTSTTPMYPKLAIGRVVFS